MVLDEPGGALVCPLLVRETVDDAELSCMDADRAAGSDFDDDLLGDVRRDIGTSLVSFPSGTSIVAEMQPSYHNLIKSICS